MLAVARGAEIAIDGVEVPEAGVGGVVEALAGAFREHVGDQAVPHVVGEGAEDVARLLVAARQEGQALEVDHRVAAPVGEPVIAGDDRARLVPGGADQGRVGHAPGRRHHELVGGQDELGGRTRAGRGWAAASSRWRRTCSARSAVSGSSASTTSQGSVEATTVAGALRLERHAEVARAPEVPGRLVAAALLHRIQDVLDRVARDAERGGRAVHAQPQPREAPSSRRARSDRPGP